MMLALPERNAIPLMPRPSGCASLTDILTSRALAAVGPAVATMSRYSLFGFTSAMVVAVNFPPLAAASHTSSNSSLRDLARIIASLVALSAASIRVRRSFCSSVLAFSSARSKLPSAKDTLSASRCSSSANSGVNVSICEEINSITPTDCPSTSSGNAAPDLAPSLRMIGRNAAPRGSLTRSFAMLACRARNAVPQSPRPSGTSGLADTFTLRAFSAVGPATATISR